MEMSIPLNLLGVILFLAWSKWCACFYEFSSTELAALQSIYNNTNGQDWLWFDYGVPWDFSAVNETYNPCTAPWQGVFCSSDCNLEPCSVEAIIFAENNMAGFLPNIFDDLPMLKIFMLEVNYITGSIPPSMCALSNLTSLVLTHNMMDGTIPNCIGNLVNLGTFSIGYSGMSGTIPDSFGNLINMGDFAISHTFINGTVPNSLSRFHNVNTFYLSYNYLTGSIPKDMLQYTKNIIELSLAYNFLEGTIPESVYFLPLVDDFDLSSNLFEGQLSESIGNLSSLQSLMLYSNNIHGPIPATIGNIVPLRILRIDNNYFTNSIPAEYCNLKNLQLVYIFGNFLSGSLPFYFFDSPQLKDLILSSNRFSQALPPYANAPLLEGLDMSLNLLSGPLDVFQALPSMTVLLVNDNFFSGTLPAVAEQYVTNLLYLNLSSNIIGGEVPGNLLYLKQMQIFDVSNNYLTGSSPAMFHNWTAVYNIYLSSNLFSGEASYLFDINQQVKLGLIDISTNGFVGTIPPSWFKLPNLHSLAAGQNCFTGSIPDVICNCANLTFLILDGLHSSSLCRHNLFRTYIPGLSTSTKNIYYLTSAITESIPSCIFNMSQLQTLHVSGNGIRGKLPKNLAIGASLMDVSMSHNDFTGLLPESIVRRPWNILDLSFNKFRGTISEDLAVRNRLDLQVNRLSGGIPSTILSVPTLNILSGNMFSCRLDGKDLPQQDPSFNTYTCGSDEVNIALEVWIILFTVVGLAILGNIYRSFARRPILRERNIYSTDSNYPQVSVNTVEDDSLSILTVWDNMQKWTSMTGIYQVTMQFSSSLSLKFATYRSKTRNTLAADEEEMKSSTSMDMFAAGDLSKANNIAKFVYIIGRFHRYLLLITFLLVIVLMPIYLALTFSFGTYTYQYAWTLSACFLDGETPAFTIFFLFLLTLLVSMLMLRSRNIVEQPHRVSSLHTFLVTKANKPLSNIATDTTKIPVLSWEDRWNTYYAPILIYTLIALINMVVVLAVNAAYVFSIGSYSFGTVFTITIFVSAFKLIWNNVVVISLVGQYTQNLLRVPVVDPTTGSSSTGNHNNANNIHSFTPSTGNFLFLILLPLFNNIFAPYIAEAFISSNCFLYAVSSPEPVTSAITDSWGCEVDDDFSINGTQVFKTNCGPNIIIPAQSAILGFTNVSSLTYNPPFLYSYQCSSSLITSFAFVFAYRYIFTGIIQPLMYLIMKYYQERRFRYLLQKKHAKDKHENAMMSMGLQLDSNMDKVLHLWTVMLPPLAKFFLPFCESPSRFPSSERNNEDIFLFNDSVARSLLQKSSSLASFFSSSSNTEQLIPEENVDFQRSNDEDANGGGSENDNVDISSPVHEQRFKDPSLQAAVSPVDKSSCSLPRPQQQQQSTEDPYKIARGGFIGKAFALRMISDLTVLLTFGVVFPPLAPLIVWSMLVESYLLIVALGRYLDVLLRSLAGMSVIDGTQVGRSISGNTLTMRQSTLWRLSSTTLATAEALLLQSKFHSISQQSSSSDSNSHVMDDVKTEWVHSQLWSSDNSNSNNNKSSVPTNMDSNYKVESGVVSTNYSKDTVVLTRIASLWSLWLLLNQSFRSFRSDFRRGIDTSFIFASIFWSFSLLDTVGNNRHSEGPKVEAFVLLVLMCTAPLWLSLMLRFILPFCMSTSATSNNAERNSSENNFNSTSNVNDSGVAPKDHIAESTWSMRKSLVDLAANTMRFEADDHSSQQEHEDELEMTSL